MNQIIFLPDQTPKDMEIWSLKFKGIPKASSQNPTSSQKVASQKFHGESQESSRWSSALHFCSMDLDLPGLSAATCACAREAWSENTAESEWIMHVVETVCYCVSVSMIIDSEIFRRKLQKLGESRKPMTSMRIAMDYSPEYLYIYSWQGEKLDSLCD